MEKVKDILTNLSSVSVGTWVRLVLMAVSMINLALTAVGKPPIELDNDKLYIVISIIFAWVVGVVNYWKNNSFTSAAQAADVYLKECGLAQEESLLGEEIL
ncbi:MAG: phage holin [Clostridia bacterium]|nr:phage holin [Clostridia bacterium]